jgi:hypothetical protein
MVNNSTNINKTNNHLSPSLTEHKKNGTMSNDVENPGPDIYLISFEILLFHIVNRKMYFSTSNIKVLID